VFRLDCQQPLPNRVTSELPCTPLNSSRDRTRPPQLRKNPAVKFHVLGLLCDVGTKKGDD
jgi:hypothetical protein